jgi:hypothetical protein
MRALMSSRPYVSFGDEGPFPSSRCLSGVRCVAFGVVKTTPLPALAFGQS